MLIDLTKTCQEFTTNGNDPYLESTIVNNAYNLVYKSSLFFEDCEKRMDKKSCKQNMGQLQNPFLQKPLKNCSCNNAQPNKAISPSTINQISVLKSQAIKTPSMQQPKTSPNLLHPRQRREAPCPYYQNCMCNSCK